MLGPAWQGSCCLNVVYDVIVFALVFELCRIELCCNMARISGWRLDVWDIAPLTGCLIRRHRDEDGVKRGKSKDKKD